jgi:hypothetical protein
MHEVEGVEWVRIPFRDPGPVGSLLRGYPAIVWRFSSAGVRRAVAELLTTRQWDALVIDSLAMAGVVDLDKSRTAFGRAPLLVYAAQNHEESTRSKLANAVPALSVKRLVLRFDARKAARLERRLVSAADFVTVVTEADAELFKRSAPWQRFVVLPPGYEGSRVEHRVIGPETPRRVVILGSYLWAAKQLNLEAFLRAAAGGLHEAGIGIDVVGAAEPAYATRTQRRYAPIRVTGAVADVSKFLGEARLGLVIEAAGGGFKLKTLDYVFNRVPVVALSGSVAGLPLVRGQSILEFKDLSHLVGGITEVIDDFDRLNQLQEVAYAACVKRFDWKERGVTLATALGATESLAEGHP